MIRRKMFSAVIAVSLAMGGLLLASASHASGRQDQHQHQHSQAAEKPQAGHQHQAHKLPAYYESVDDVKDIPQTLAPEQFSDPAVREAYQVARDNPKLLMQMPCFCYCDRPGLDHKSLLSCFVDKHGANCDLCVNEAVTAAKLASDNLSVAEVRERVIAEFSKGH